MTDNFPLLISVTTAVLITLAIGFLAVLLASHKRTIEQQRIRMRTIEESERRYKALFDNSFAGIMKFDFASWTIIDANRTILEMFSCRTTEELQGVFRNLPADIHREIGMSLQEQGTVDECEMEFRPSSGIVRQFSLSARRDGKETTAHAIVVFVTARKMFG